MYHEVWLSNNVTAYEKKCYFQNYSTIECTLSIYSPVATNHSIHFFHWSKQCWKSSFVRTFSCSANFCFSSSIDSNQVPFKADLIFGKGKSHRLLNQACTACVRALECLQWLNTVSQTAFYEQ